MKKAKPKTLHKNPSIKAIKPTQSVCHIDTEPRMSKPLMCGTYTCRQSFQSECPAQSILNAAVRNTVFYRSISRSKQDGIAHDMSTQQKKPTAMISPSAFEIALLKSMECDGIISVLKSKCRSKNNDTEKIGEEIPIENNSYRDINKPCAIPERYKDMSDKDSPEVVNTVKESKVKKACVYELPIKYDEAKKQHQNIKVINEIQASQSQIDDNKNESVTSIEAVLIGGIADGSKSNDYSFDKTTNSVSRDCSMRFNEMVNQPYIQRVRETSKKYKEVITKLHTLAKYNDELKAVIRKESGVMPEECTEMLKKNRDIRIFIKTNLREEENKENNNATKKQTKRELIKIRDILLEENEKLLFEMKRKYLV